MTVAIILIILGALIKFGKMYFMISGYNTMSKSEREKYDMQKVATFIWFGFLIMALVIIAGHYISLWQNIPALEDYITIAALLIVSAYMAWKLYYKKAFRKK